MQGHPSFQRSLTPPKDPFCVIDCLSHTARGQLRGSALPPELPEQPCPTQRLADGSAPLREAAEAQGTSRRAGAAARAAWAPAPLPQATAALAMRPGTTNCCLHQIGMVLREVN